MHIIALSCHRLLGQLQLHLQLLCKSQSVPCAVMRSLFVNMQSSATVPKHRAMSTHSCAYIHATRPSQFLFCEVTRACVQATWSVMPLMSALVCTYVCMHVCMYACMYICICVVCICATMLYVYVCVRMSACTQTSLRKLAQAAIQALIHACTNSAVSAFH